MQQAEFPVERSTQQADPSPVERAQNLLLRLRRSAISEQLHHPQTRPRNLKPLAPPPPPKCSPNSERENREKCTRLRHPRHFNQGETAAAGREVEIKANAVQ